MHRWVFILRQTLVLRKLNSPTTQQGLLRAEKLKAAFSATSNVTESRNCSLAAPHGSPHLWHSRPTFFLSPSSLFLCSLSLTWWNLRAETLTDSPPEHSRHPAKCLSHLGFLLTIVEQIRNEKKYSWGFHASTIATGPKSCSILRVSSSVSSQKTPFLTFFRRIELFCNVNTAHTTQQQRNTSNQSKNRQKI